jgi:hypothetical protein
VGFWLLEFGTLEFRPNIHPLVERTVFSLLAQSSLLVHGAYGLLLISSVVYIVRLRGALRQRPWIVFAAILFFLFVPVEIYSMVLDLQMWRLDASGSNDLVEYRKLFIHRLGALSGVPMIALLCYYTAAAALVFRPGMRAGTPPPPGTVP